LAGRVRYGKVNNWARGIFGWGAEYSRIDITRQGGSDLGKVGFGVKIERELDIYTRDLGIGVIYSFLRVFRAKGKVVSLTRCQTNSCGDTDWLKAAPDGLSFPEL